MHRATAVESSRVAQRKLGTARWMAAHVVPPAIKAFRQHDRIYAFKSSTARYARPKESPISTGCRPNGHRSKGSRYLDTQIGLGEAGEGISIVPSLGFQHAAVDR